MQVCFVTKAMRLRTGSVVHRESNAKLGEKRFGDILLQRETSQTGQLATAKREGRNRNVGGVVINP